MENAVKDTSNTFFNSKYATLASVLNAVRGPLASNGLSIVQHSRSAGTGVVVSTMLMHESGEWLCDKGPLLPVTKKDPQGYGSAITYGRRYGLSSILGISQEDDDGNANRITKGKE